MTANSATQLSPKHGAPFIVLCCVSSQGQQTLPMRAMSDPSILLESLSCQRRDWKARHRCLCATAEARSPQKALEELSQLLTVKEAALWDLDRSKLEQDYHMARDHVEHLQMQTNWKHEGV